jgi:predicted dehydrogenase
MTELVPWQHAGNIATLDGEWNLQIRTAVVGLGYWGPNLARNVAASTDFELIGLCDSSEARLRRIGAFYPAARCFERLDDLLDNAPPDLLTIATPVGSHHALAARALRAGCHVLVEKPLTATVEEAEDLLAISQAEGRHLFVDHTFLFTGAVAEISRQLRSGALGELLYVDSVRIALGLFQPDVDVIWDLAPHDLSILDHLVGRPPATVRALGSSHNPRGTVDVAYLHLEYGKGLHAHLHLSWLSPVKVRRVILAGSRQSLIYDDLEPTEKVKLYDHGVEFDVGDTDTRRQVLINYRKGDMRAPGLPVTEALATEFSHIAGVLRHGLEPLASGEAGCAVVRILEAAGESLRRGGEAVPLTRAAAGTHCSA